METGNLRNEDFRKLLSSSVRKTAVPTAPETPSHESQATHTFSHKRPKPVKKKLPPPKPKKEKDEEDTDEANLKEILKNYRDRAEERRTKRTEDDDTSKLTAAYRAVPRDSRAARDQANMRRQAIEESKYLGGDMEHTHLVKGLDYSLLNKVRSEIVKSQVENDDDELDKALLAKEKEETSTSAQEKPSENRMVRGINRVLFQTEIPQKNDLFAKGRMAYVVELEDEEADLPTTLLRSLMDCPHAESNATVAANNTLISKLTQVLGYLRTDNKKKKKPEMAEVDVKKYKDQSIFDADGDYVPSKERDKRDARDDGKKKDRNYFDDDKDRRDRDRDRRDHHRERDRDDKRDDRRGGRDYDKDRGRDREREREKDKERERARRDAQEAEKQKALEDKLEKRRKAEEAGGYDECYPGGYAEVGGAWDSDEEADFTKMDQGQRKGPIKRWDFDSQEDYEKYQGQREALPKAAYQFGVKTGDGRKTRKSNMDANKKLDRELDQINRLMDKRKIQEEKGEYKKPKY